MQEITLFLSNLGMWSWLSFGLILIILELFIPGTFIIWFGFGAMITGIFVGLFSLTISAQIAIFSIASAVCVIFGFFVYKKIFGKNKENSTNPQVGAKKYIGKKFKVIEAIQNGTGKVAIGDTVWLAKSDTDIPKGTMVQVIETESTILIVRK